MSYLRRSWHKHHGLYTSQFIWVNSPTKTSERASPGIFCSLRFVRVASLRIKEVVAGKSPTANVIQLVSGAQRGTISKHFVQQTFVGTHVFESTS